VLTKENSVFVWIAIVALLMANRWLKIGTVTGELIIATALGSTLFPSSEHAVILPGA
jgi:hypothetical protein